MTIVWEGKADILESNCHTLICPVNTVGVMGKGLALAFARKFPGLEKEYKQACAEGVFSREKCFVFDTPDDKKVYCMPTKRHWRYPSKLPWIEDAFINLVERYEMIGIQSIAIPAVGCGEGKLPWEEVRQIIYRYMEHLDIDVHIFVP